MLFGLFNKDEKVQLNNPVAVEIPYGDAVLRLETGRMAKQANGAALPQWVKQWFWRLFARKNLLLKGKISFH